jgi:acetolactate synthase-1/2/3 large subunit
MSEGSPDPETDLGSEIVASAIEGEAESPASAVAPERPELPEPPAALEPPAAPEPSAAPEPHEQAEEPGPREPDEPAATPEPDEPADELEPRVADEASTLSESAAVVDGAELPETGAGDVGAEETAAHVAAPEREAAPQPEAAPEPPPAPVMVRRTVSQEIARQLHASGVRYCFTVPAEPILQLLDDLAAEGIRVVTTRHEGGAAFMAEALSQSTGRPQVVAVSRAVGASNAAVGIHSASQDSAPLVALAGQVRSDLLGREAFQESDLVNSVGSLAAWSAQIDAPGQCVAVLEKAWRRLNTGRPGPILLAVPEDVQAAEIELADGDPPKPPGARGPAADRSTVSRALKMLAASERGVIVAGGGVLRARATKRLVALSEALAIPVIASWRRPDVFPNDHANYLGMAGSWSASTVPQRLADADVIMFVGTRLSEMTTDGYAIPGEEQRWIHVDVHPRVARAGLPGPTLSVVADASRFLDSAWSDLRGAALDNEMRSRREARMAADREAYRAASDVTLGTWEGPGVHPGHVFRVLRAALPDNAIITTDAGNLAAWVARGYRFRRAGTFLGATSGTMGFGLPAAIAASLMDPDRIAVAICGDGGFAMTMNELETAVREGSHPIAIVLDNQRYGTIWQRQAEEGRPTNSTELGAIDFAAVARAHGALGITVTQDASFEPALREAITSRQPSVIHVTVDRGWHSVDDNPVSGA